jgi:DNA-directed RNA polymerase subunit RPC12/RpoP
MKQSLVEKYVKNEGALCPYCDSKDMEGGNYEAEGDTITMKVSCNNCGKEWFDIYKLVSATEP